jgi:pimeloyl-ACP methyl ester carboxylesterase
MPHDPAGPRSSQDISQGDDHQLSTLAAATGQPIKTRRFHRAGATATAKSMQPCVYEQPRTNEMELVRFTTEDDFPLDGAYRAADSSLALLHVHGKGGNFYSGPSYFLPEHTRSRPMAHLAMNMRCHDLGYTRWDTYNLGPGERTAVSGGMWERIADGHLDLAAGVTFLRARGYERIVLIGHSSGGFYSVDYAAHDSEIAGRVLLSPLTSNRSAFPRWFPSKTDRNTAVEQARRLADAGYGHHLVTIPSWYFAVSADSLLERENEPEHYWWNALELSSAPVLIVWGLNEGRHRTWKEIYHQTSVPIKRKLVLPTSDHYYNGFEQQISHAVADFAIRC